ncbi:LysE family translocator [Reyranella aquatilis]|jgi:threonine/homoserine/homoserine lactone efflux protein|uniref:LysE family translocator n=1 Tax=Reyranella aquatilis TaxID=2035356 RepID=A0ABS8L0H4_9HYPH|nr:LysE family translocator [Reyranella aquatilis]MCC8431844.1 LysE family translocator [Reyranella aquatilis]
MVDLSTLALFAVAALALTLTPGPDMLLIASRSASQGRAAGFATLAGIQAGTYCHALAAAFGLSQLFLIVPVAYDAVRYAGAAYLLYLAWATVRSGVVTAAPEAGATRPAAGTMFRQGLLTNLLNPKMALFVLALFPQFVQPEAGSVAVQVLVLATVLNAIGVIVNGAVILGASRLGRLFAGQGRFRRLSQYFLGAIFAGLATRLAFDGRT